MSVAQNIRRRRLELNMSQQELADALGYKSRSTIAKIEAGENDISHRKLKSFAEALNTSIEHLMIEEEFSSPKTAQGLMQEQKGSRVAVILAGGKSTRNLQNIPNQFINVYGKPVILYCIEAYQRHPAIDEIYVVCLKGWEDILDAYIKQCNLTKLRDVIPGGSTGIESIRRAVDKLTQTHDEDTCVFLQESTRPMVNEELISNACTCYNLNGSAIAGTRMTDIIQFVESERGDLHYIDRNSIHSVQSPEVYRLGALAEAFREATARDMELNETCCAMLMYNLERELCFFNSSAANIKIVRQEDLAVFKALIKQE